MAEILDNQEVTTDTLNNIAIDLGATTFNGFTTNKFGVDELNNITKSLVSKGVTQGSNKCKPYLSGSDLYISTGTIIFDTGAKIRITSPQQVTAQVSTYIYALNDTSRNIAEIVVSETKPTTGDFVLLAYLDENSKLTDMREWSRSNVLLTSNQPLTKSISMEKTETGASMSTEIELNWSSWNYVLFEHKYYDEYRSTQTFISTMAELITDNVETDIIIYTYYTHGDRNLKYKLTKNGSKINIVYNDDIYTLGTFEFELIFI